MMVLAVLAAAALGPLPCVTGDIVDRKYEVLEVVTANVRGQITSSFQVDRDKVCAVLEKRARKIGADALIFMTSGKPRVTLMSVASTPATAKAIKFLP